MAALGVFRYAVTGCAQCGAPVNVEPGTLGRTHHCSSRCRYRWDIAHGVRKPNAQDEQDDQNNGE